jgi:hypothetical protein
MSKKHMSKITILGNYHFRKFPFLEIPKKELPHQSTSPEPA